MRLNTVPAVFGVLLGALTGYIFNVCGQPLSRCIAVGVMAAMLIAVLLAAEFPGKDKARLLIKTTVGTSFLLFLVSNAIMAMAGASDNLFWILNILLAIVTALVSWMLYSSKI